MRSHSHFLNSLHLIAFALLLAAALALGGCGRDEADAPDAQQDQSQGTVAVAETPVAQENKVVALDEAQVPLKLGGITAVSSGANHTCALTTAGGVLCWGSNSHGELGIGEEPRQSAPVAVQGLSSGVQAISVGDFHTCALTVNGSVKCWGGNSFGILGNGNEDDQAVPVDVVGLNSDVKAISAGQQHTCVLTTTGGVKCWGVNERGQLGDNTTTNRQTPVGVTGLSSGIQAISAGREHTCALTTAGGIKCWGYGGMGLILGGGSVQDQAAPVDVSGLDAGVQAISTGEYFTCALTATGGVKCWGSNYTNGMGDITGTDKSEPVDVSGLSSDVRAISAGEDYACALTAAGAVKCWGGNDFGQLGNGMAVQQQREPVDVVGLSADVQAVSAGSNHTCAVTTTGNVKCWGSNGSGKLGNGTKSLSSIPVDVAGLETGVTDMSVGDAYACAVTATGGAKCWGSNAHGELGDTAFARSYMPVEVIGLSSGVQTISAGAEHACALTTAGGVKCWGDNEYGQLGMGLDTEQREPVDVIGLSAGVQAIGVGEQHTCALTAAGGVKCWGSNRGSQLGDGTHDSRYAPVDVVGLSSDVKAIGVGKDHACAVTMVGGVKCWGSNDSGQLGDGTDTAHLTPVNVSVLSSAVQAVTAGESYTCVLTEAGEVKCWGENDSGHLGDGTQTTRFTPVDVMGLGPDVRAISAGKEHVCALTKAGGVKCWGDNSLGRLGDGTRKPQLGPVDVVGLGSGVQAISAGYAHTCVQMADAGVKCWGDNWSGQLGADPGWTPVDVLVADE